MQEVQFPEHGIYAILNIVNDKMYIGSAVNFKLRWRLHTNELNRNDHKNSYLQRSWNKYGQSNFMFVILEIVSDKFNLIDREQHWIDSLKPNYNLAPVAGSMLGFKHSEETKASYRKIRANTSIETRLKISKSHTGLKRSAEHIANAANGKKGFKHSEATKLKMRLARLALLEKGFEYKPSEETKAKISKAMIEYNSCGK